MAKISKACHRESQKNILFNWFDELPILLNSKYVTHYLMRKEQWHVKRTF
jgi:hypothetical protein